VDVPEEIENNWRAVHSGEEILVRAATGESPRPSGYKQRRAGASPNKSGAVGYLHRTGATALANGGSGRRFFLPEREDSIWFSALRPRALRLRAAYSSPRPSDLTAAMSGGSVRSCPFATVRGAL
jgi:hypothetical protein